LPFIIIYVIEYILYSIHTYSIGSVPLENHD
jgi:hypothetical protein